MGNCHKKHTYIIIQNVEYKMSYELIYSIAVAVAIERYAINPIRLLLTVYAISIVYEVEFKFYLSKSNEFVREILQKRK